MLIFEAELYYISLPVRCIPRSGLFVEIILTVTIVILRYYTATLCLKSDDDLLLELTLCSFTPFTRIIKDQLVHRDVFAEPLVSKDASDAHPFKMSRSF